MATHVTLHEYFEHQHRNIGNYLELCLMHPEAELVHELRLSIKKLRAFDKLAEQICLNETTEYIYNNHRVRQLYKVAGQLRDTQVQMQLLNSFEEQTGIEYPEFGRWLLRREVKRVSRFSKKPRQIAPLITSKSTHQQIGDLLALADDETILRSAVKVLLSFYSEARSLSAGRMNYQNLHRIRTITKEMKYILNIMRNSYPDFIFSEISVESLREIEVAAGKWHDNLVRVELLGRYMEKIESGNDSDKFKYKKFFYACKSELDISYNETLKNVRKELNAEIMN